MHTNLQTLAGTLRWGDEIVAMLLSPNEEVQRIRLEAIASDKTKRGELCHAINNLRDHLRVMALDGVKIETGLPDGHAEWLTFERHWKALKKYEREYPNTGGGAEHARLKAAYEEAERAYLKAV